MRLSICTTVIACATHFATSIAAPTTKSAQPNEKNLEQQAEELQRRDEVATKYFLEPGGDDTLGHYDARYFHEVVSDGERTDTQSHMIRAYLEFFREKGLDTWIAHGTLLGWWWNGKRLPWDYDLDTQVSGATLQYLGANYNQTRFNYTSPDGKISREFLLDVNPWIWQRERGNGMNIIDARWIDVRNGLFIDITGLSEVHPDNQPGVWSCKNYHFYKTEDLYPMRETMFEGVMAKVPYQYDKILTDEYTENALISTEFHGHRWNLEFKAWVKNEQTMKREDEERDEKEKEVKKKALEQAKLD
ncbi:Nn.00g074930.m01.CDS01 [Neocucurbitaria sp. VM-36]